MFSKKKKYSACDMKSNFGILLRRNSLYYQIS